MCEVTREQKRMGCFDSGQDSTGGWGEGRQGSLLLGFTVTCQHAASGFCDWPAATEKVPVKDLPSPNLRKHLELDQLPGKSRFFRVGLNNCTEFLLC